MLSKNKDWFYYNKYWGIWQRVILRGGGAYAHQVLIPITPSNDDTGSWNEVAEIQIRRTRISADKHQEETCGHWTHHLPDDVYETIVNKLGKTKADMLVHADIYKLVDWAEFAKYGGFGTTPLHLCRRDLQINFRAIFTDEFGSRSIYLKPAQFSLHADYPEPVNSELLGGIIIQDNDKKKPNTLIVIYQDLISGNVITEINSSVPDKEERNTRLICRHSEIWNDRIEAHSRDLVDSGHIEEKCLSTIIEVAGNAWALAHKLENNIKCSI